MCFSAGASFSASVVLAVTGVLTLKKAEHKQQYLFASIPLLFAIQQFIEGFVWLSLSNTDYAFINTVSVYGFLIFAQVVWPFWLPLSILILEQKPIRKKVITYLTIVGGAVSVFLAFSLVYYHPLAQIVSCHIQYKLSFPLASFKFSEIFYFMPTVLPLFISSIKRMWVFGIAIFVSYVATEIFYTEFALSVWCFFAAILSVIIYYTISKITEGNRKDKMKQWWKE